MFRSSAEKIVRRLAGKSQFKGVLFIFTKKDPFLFQVRMCFFRIPETLVGQWVKEANLQEGGPGPHLDVRLVCNDKTLVCNNKTLECNNKTLVNSSCILVATKYVPTLTKSIKTLNRCSYCPQPTVVVLAGFR